MTADILKQFESLGQILQNDGPSPIVPINYTQEYTKLMNHFRFACHDDIKTHLTFDLTTEILMINPSHYSVWKVSYFKDSTCFCSFSTTYIWFSPCSSDSIASCILLNKSPLKKPRHFYLTNFILSLHWQRITLNAIKFGTIDNSFQTLLIQNRRFLLIYQGKSNLSRLN